MSTYLAHQTGKRIHRFYLVPKILHSSLSLDTQWQPCQRAWSPSMNLRDLVSNKRQIKPSSPPRIVESFYKTQSLYFKIFICIFRVWMFRLYVCLCTACVQSHRGQKRGPGTGAADGCEPLCRCWESDPGPLHHSITPPPLKPGLFANGACFKQVYLVSGAKSLRIYMGAY